MNDEIRTRLRWAQLYEELGNAGVVCQRCGISRKWWQRYQELGIDGLKNEVVDQKDRLRAKLSQCMNSSLLPFGSANLDTVEFK